MALKLVGPAPVTGTKLKLIGPAPQQLRAGTGGFWSDIKQDAANAFLPERFAAEIAQKQNPGSEIYQDDKGNWILRRADGTEHYLNEPGLGVQDAINVTGALAIPGIPGATSLALRGMGAVGGRAAAMIDTPLMALRGLGASNPLIAGMAAGGTYSAAQQGVGAALTDQPASLLEVGQGAVFGGVVPGAQKYGGMALDGLANITGSEAIRNPIKAALYGIERIRTPKGDLTPTAKEALTTAGIRWQNFTPEQIELANSKTADVLGMNTQAQGRAAGLATVGVNNPTPGMLSQRPDMIKDEVAGINRRGREASVQQLQAYGDTLGSPNNLEGAANKLVDLHDAASASRNQAFDAARRAGERAPVAVDLLTSLRDNMVKSLQRDLSDDQISAAMASFPKLPEVKTGSILGPDGKPISTFDLPAEGNVDPQTIRSLFEWRRDHLGVDGTGKAKNAFDAEMDRWIDQALVSDIGAKGIAAWKAANKEMTELSGVWRAKDVIEKLVQKDAQGVALKVDPEAAANMLLNASDIGFITKPQLRGDIEKLKSLLGEDSAEFQGLRDAMAYRALKLRSGFSEGQRQGSLQVSGTAMKNHWNRVKKDGGDVLDELYPAETLDAFENFVEYARMMDTKLGTEVTVSDDQMTGMMAHIFKRLGSATFRFSRATFQEASEKAKDVGADKALREFYGDLYVPRGMSTPLIASGEASEAIWSEVYDSLLRDLGYNIPGGPEPLQIDILNGVPQP